MFDGDLENAIPLYKKLYQITPIEEEKVRLKKMIDKFEGALEEGENLSLLMIIPNKYSIGWKNCKKNGFKKVRLLIPLKIAT